MQNVTDTATKTATMMAYRSYELTIRPRATGRLEPWMGSALRGVVARAFKRNACGHPPQVREEEWVHCDGCPLQHNCSYGVTYETGLTDRSAAPQGVHEPSKPIVVAPFFPLPAAPLTPQQTLPVHVHLFGNAVFHANPFFHSFADGIRHRGIGEDGLTFDLIDVQQEETRFLCPTDFPLHAAAMGGTIPQLSIGLTAPLFLRQRDKNRVGTRRQQDWAPSFADLFIASERIVRNLFWFYGERMDMGESDLRDLAFQVPLAVDRFEPFRKHRYSSRTETRRDELGVIGMGTYTDVPLAFLPWLIWGGRCHVGQERVAGAGSWRILTQ